MLWGVMKVMFAFGVCVWPVFLFSGQNPSLKRQTCSLKWKQTTSLATRCILPLFTHHFTTKVVSLTISFFVIYLIYLIFISYLKMAPGH